MPFLKVQSIKKINKKIKCTSILFKYNWVYAGTIFNTPPPLPLKKCNNVHF